MDERRRAAALSCSAWSEGIAGGGKAGPKGGYGELEVGREIERERRRREGARGGGGERKLLLSSLRDLLTLSFFFSS